MLRSIEITNLDQEDKLCTVNLLIIDFNKYVEEVNLSKKILLLLIVQDYSKRYTYHASLLNLIEGIKQKILERDLI